MKLSIVTVCRNDAIGLSSTIASVRKQSFRDYEYIVIDGASTDGTIDIINNNLDLISHWKSEPDNGIYNAMNKSLQYCSGDYVIFMNAGDCFFDDNVLKNVFHKNNNSDVIYGDVMFDKPVPANQKINSLQDFFCKSPFCHQGVFAKREQISKLGFDENYKIVADWAMFVSLFMDGASFEYVPYVIAQCKSGGVSSDAGNNNKERLSFLTNRYSKRLVIDYLELEKLKNGVLFDYYFRIEQTKKLKYYIHSILRFFHI